MVKITTLIENNPAEDQQLLYEHGLSLYIEIDDCKLLFDTGQSGDFVKNAAYLNCDLSDLDYVVMSHGHYDHSGGFKTLLPLLDKKTKIVIGDSFFEAKYKALDDGKYKNNGNSFSLKDIDQAGLKCQLISDDLTKINDQLYIFKNFSLSNDYEIIPTKFRIKENDEYRQDNFDDEIALGIKSGEAFIIIVGCSHRGIVNILSDIQQHIDLPIKGLIGGTHLVEADESRIQKTLAYLDTLGLSFVAFSHCTGPAIKTMQKHFAERFILNNTGNIIEF